LAEALQVDVEDICSGMAADASIAAVPTPGCGFGGAGLPRNLRALQRVAQDHGVALPTVAAAEQTNQRQKGLLARRAIEWFGGSLAGRRIALWGLAVAPGSDDLREAPSEMLIAMLVGAGARVVAHDPVAMPAARRQHGQQRALSFAAEAIDAVDQADALLIATDWPEYRRTDWAAVHARMATPVVLDGRNVCDPAQLAALGFAYQGVGRRRFAKFAAFPSTSAPRPREPVSRVAVHPVSAPLIGAASRA
jgi:UDPglucose 6-dehydrogenase